MDPPVGQDEVRVPSGDEWVDHGEVLASGGSGWDRRLEGAISPSAVIKKEGTYILYYIGADGDRYDGGPANRALGAALSTDGIRFERWSGNPVVTYQPSAPGGENVVEEGVFSAAAVARTDGGQVTLLFGGMEATGATAVNGTGVLATSSDGLSFETVGPVIAPGDPRTVGSDELFPMGLAEVGPGEWVAYYITTGGGGNDWSWAAALGSGPSDFDRHVLVLDAEAYPHPGGSGPIWISDQRFVVPVLRGWGGERAVVDFRVVDVSNPTNLSRVLASVEFENLFHLTVLLDRERETWFLYYLDAPGESIRVKTAPMVTGSGGGA